jgi:hypothetical protein
MNSLDSKQDKNKNELCAKFWCHVILSTEHLTTGHFANYNFVKDIRQSCNYLYESFLAGHFVTFWIILSCHHFVDGSFFKSSQVIINSLVNWSFCQLIILTTGHFAIDNFVKVIWPSFTDLYQSFLTGHFVAFWIILSCHCFGSWSFLFIIINREFCHSVILSTGHQLVILSTDHFAKILFLHQILQKVCLSTSHFVITLFYKLVFFSRVISNRSFCQHVILLDSIIGSDISIKRLKRKT